MPSYASCSTLCHASCPKSYIAIILLHYNVSYFFLCAVRPAHVCAHDTQWRHSDSEIAAGCWLGLRLERAALRVALVVVVRFEPDQQTLVNRVAR